VFATGTPRSARAEESERGHDERGRMAHSARVSVASVGGQVRGGSAVRARIRSCCGPRPARRRGSRTAWWAPGADTNVRSSRNRLDSLFPELVERSPKLVERIAKL